MKPVWYITPWATGIYMITLQSGNREWTTYFDGTTCEYQTSPSYIKIVAKPRPFITKKQQHPNLITSEGKKLALECRTVKEIILFTPNQLVRKDDFCNLSRVVEARQAAQVLAPV